MAQKKSTAPRRDSVESGRLKKAQEGVIPQEEGGFLWDTSGPRWLARGIRFEFRDTPTPTDSRRPRRGNNSRGGGVTFAGKNLESMQLCFVQTRKELHSSRVVRKSTIRTSDWQHIFHPECEHSSAEEFHNCGQLCLWDKLDDAEWLVSIESRVLASGYAAVVEQRPPQMLMVSADQWPHLNGRSPATSFPTSFWFINDEFSTLSRLQHPSASAGNRLRVRLPIYSGRVVDVLAHRHGHLHQNNRHPTHAVADVSQGSPEHGQEPSSEIGRQFLHLSTKHGELLELFEPFNRPGVGSYSILRHLFQSPFKELFQGLHGSISGKVSGDFLGGSVFGSNTFGNYFTTSPAFSLTIRSRLRHFEGVISFSNDSRGTTEPPLCTQINMRSVRWSITASDRWMLYHLLVMSFI
ncbi:hypothetical protein QBC40DRAFT_296936 [Triangularia verruculosa]|uniref:Uncharacterized protein n=1 Tax=Triangularia verruculosa TaxID=2587418 RepID=A0AAN7AVD3_9PEZI|nr:hypothetical protein QBC40DRAFT_296936 [Triangularia verruculosa]